MLTPENKSVMDPFLRDCAGDNDTTIEMSNYSGFKMSDKDIKKVIKHEPKPVDPRIQAKFRVDIERYFNGISPGAFTELFNAITRVNGQKIKDKGAVIASQAKEEAIAALKVCLGRSRDSFFTQSEIAFILTLATEKYTVDVFNFSHPEN